MIKKLAKKVFGYSPSILPAWAYNSLCAACGAILLGQTWAQTFGIILLMEAILVSIERCWPKDERPE